MTPTGRATVPHPWPGSTAPLAPAAPTAAEMRARALLASLLRPSELDQWRRTGGFWVHTPAGWFRFGTLYDIRFRSPRWPAVERSICVVTEGFEERPLPDLWAELVVTARAAPDTLAATANFRGEAPARAPGERDPVVLRRWLAAQRDAFQRLRRHGHQLDAAYLAFDTAHRTRRSSRPAWAAPFATAATELVRAHVAAYPDEQPALERAHRPIVDLLS